MEFRCGKHTARLRDPADPRRVLVEDLQYRIDPLTGSRTQINAHRADRNLQAEGGGVDIREMAEETREGCPFCPANIAEATPLFTSDISPTGRIVRGQTTLFPNRYPFAQYHAVGIVSKAHFLRLGEFTSDLIADNLLAVQEYVRAVNSTTDDPVYPAWTWNYMPPSAASVIHPHTQTVAELQPPPGLAATLERSIAYRANFNSCFRD